MAGEFWCLLLLPLLILWKMPPRAWMWLFGGPLKTYTHSKTEEE